MEKLFNLKIKVEVVDGFEDIDTIARCKYQSDGDEKIQIIKGLNTIEFSQAIHHEIGHLFDWYLSNNKQSKNKEIREENADVIGNIIRFKEYYKENN